MSPAWELLPDPPVLFEPGKWIISEQRPTIDDFAGVSGSATKYPNAPKKNNSYDTGKGKRKKAFTHIKAIVGGFGRRR